MKKTQVQKKKDAEFIKKLASLTFGFGKAGGHCELPACPDCGKPMQLAGIELRITPVSQPRQEERAFCE